MFLLICPMVFLAGFVDAIAGGGGLISLPAYMIAGLPVHNAIATNKVSSMMGTSVATAKYAFNGFIPWKQCPFYIVCAFIGSAIGANLALALDDRMFKILMLIILPLTLYYVTKSKNFSEVKEPLPYRKTVLIGMACALVIGVYDGFYGPGTGTFLILLLTSLAHMDLKTANGTTKAINLSTNISAFTVYVINGTALLHIGLIAGLFNIAGNYLGATAFSNKSTKFVKPVMITVLVVFIIKIVTELV